jgi:hypothetical protein
VRRRHFYADADEASAVAEVLRVFHGCPVMVVLTTVDPNAGEWSVNLVDRPDDDDDPPVDSRWDREREDRDEMRGRHSHDY